MRSIGSRAIVWVGVAAILAAAGPARGEEMKLWPGGAPGARGTAKNDTPTLKVFPPPKGVKGPAPAVLLIPGGGYKHLSAYGTYWKFFSTRPVRFFTLRYRLPVHGYRHSAPLQDAQRAVSTLRANAASWNLDPKRIVVVAFSSGGHVASTLATHYHLGRKDAKDPVDRFSCRPDFVALFCPVVSMKNHPHRPSVARLLGPKPDAKLIDDLSNELQVDARTPPTFLAHAKDDNLVPPENSILFHEALTKAGVATRLHLYPQGAHDVTKAPNPWQRDLEAWLVASGVMPKPAAGQKPAGTLAYEPTSHYTVKNIEGWKVYVNNALLDKGEHAKTGTEAIERLRDSLIRLKTWIPEAPLAKLLKVTVWLEVDSTNGPHGRTSGYQYHPGAGWLKKMDFHPDKVKCVEYGSAASLTRRTPDRAVTVLLHEMAHAYHDQVLDFNHAEVMAAHKRARKEGKYPPRDWVVRANHKEFFAGVTTRYFGTKTEREALVKRDPILAKLLLKIWGKPKATMDTPPPKGDGTK